MDDTTWRPGENQHQVGQKFLKFAMWSAAGDGTKPKCTKQSLVALMTRDPTTGRSKEVQICQVASSPGANGIEVVM